MKALVSISLVAVTAATAAAQLSDNDLRRYGFARDQAPLHQPHMRRFRPGHVAHEGPHDPARCFVPTREDFDPGEIPAPRRTRLPTGGPEFRAPPTPDGARPLILQEIPGVERPVVGAPQVPYDGPEDAPARYVGDTTCLSCHQDYAREPERSHMALSRQSASLPPERRGCEGCHGPGSKHFGDPRYIVNPAKQEPNVASRTCLDCHKMAGLTDAHEWFFSRHASARLSCTTCHQIHENPRPDLLRDHPDDLCIACHRDTARTFAMRSHHPVRAAGIRPLRSLTQGKVSCIDCHDPHGGPGEDDGMLRDSLEETCARCHPGFVGPFVFPHVTPREGGGCLACHLPHGSPNRELLRSRGRSTCLQCHQEQVRHFPSQGCNTTSCHGAVHGSNRDPLFFR